MAHSTAASPAKKKSKLDDGALKLKDDDHPPQQPSKNLVSISECGNAVASFLTFHERGRLLLVNHQLNDEHWGIVKEKTYGPLGMSAVVASILLFRVACSEFAPERLADCFTGDHDDIISALRGDGFDYSFTVSEYIDKEGWNELKNFWCDTAKCYDISGIENGLSHVTDEEALKDLKESLSTFFQQVNALLSKLKDSCDYLEGLESNATPFPDLYKYLIEVAGVEQAWLDRFAEIRYTDWGKSHVHSKEPPSYHTAGPDGISGIYSVDQLFPGQDTIRALPSKSYKPKPIHLRECIKCHEVKADISYFECPYKWCKEEHKGKCGDCAPTSKCASCGKSGCKCCFVTCSSEGCTRKMCSCGNFDGWKDSDRGGAPGCSWHVPSNNEDEIPADGVEVDMYCSVHKPEGAEKFETAVCVIM